MSESAIPSSGLFFSFLATKIISFPNWSVQPEIGFRTRARSSKVHLLILSGEVGCLLDAVPAIGDYCLQNIATAAFLLLSSFPHYFTSSSFLRIRKIKGN